MDPVELERYGATYWKCPACEYGSFIESQTRAHLRDHEPRPTLDEVLAAQAAPTPEPRTRRSRP